MPRVILVNMFNVIARVRFSNKSW